MKKQYLLIWLLCLPLLSLAQQKEGRLQLSYAFTGIKEGYNHQEKVDLYLNDKLIYSGPAAAMDEKRAMDVSLPPGTWELRLESWVWYDEQWEAQTVANGYNIDAVWTSTIKVKKKKNLKIDLEFDIAQNEIREL